MGRADLAAASASGLQARPATEADVEGAIETYRAHVLSLLRSIWLTALTTPSTLWFRGAAVPAFLAFTTWNHAPGTIWPVVVGAAAAAVVPCLVALFVWLQLHMLVRKGLDKDLSSDKLLGYFSDAGWGKASRFFVVTRTDKDQAEGEVVGCVGLANRGGGQGELTYFAVRPGTSTPGAVADALLEAAVAQARKAQCFDSLHVKLNSAETGLLDAAARAGLGTPQLLKINAWFRAFRLTLYLKGR